MVSVIVVVSLVMGTVRTHCVPVDLSQTADSRYSSRFFQLHPDPWESPCSHSPAHSGKYPAIDPDSLGTSANSLFHSYIHPTGSSYGLVLLSNCCLHRPQSSLLCLLLTPSLQTLPTQWPWFDPSIWSLVFQHWRWCAHQNTTTDNSTQYTTSPQSSILHHHVLSKEVVHGQLNCHSVCRGCNVLWSPHSFVVGWNMLVEV